MAEEKQDCRIHFRGGKLPPAAAGEPAATYSRGNGLNASMLYGQSGRGPRCLSVGVLRMLESRKSVLVAARVDVARRISNALTPSDFDVSVVHSYEDALARLASPIDLVVGGIFFDYGQVFDLFSEIRKNPSTGTTPCICVKGDLENLSADLLVSISRVCEGLGVEGLVDYGRWRTYYGEAEADEMLRALLRSRLR